MKLIVTFPVLSCAWVVSFLHVSLAWSGEPTSRRSILRDQILLPMMGAITYTPSETAFAVETNERKTNDASISSGVLWRATGKDGMGAWRAARLKGGRSRVRIR